MASPPPDVEIREKPSFSAPSRWLSVKKKGSASRSKSRERKLPDEQKPADSADIPKQEKHDKERFSGDAFRNLFNKSDKEKGKVYEEPDLYAPASKSQVSLVQEALNKLSVEADIKEIKRALTSPYSNGEPTEAARLIDIWQKSAAGKVIPFDKRVPMKGAVNLNSVSCYLDALFFSIFSKMAVFECMLSFDFPKDKTGNKKRLARLLCLWVNLMRSGFLVREDVTRDIQQALSDCGWPEAMDLQQQDSTEAFNFITDVLDFPLQPLRMNIAHGGKVDEGDDKIAFERLLNVAMPDHPSEGGIKLEECLTSYFNATPVKIERIALDSEKKRGTRASSSKVPLVRTTSIEAVPEVVGTSAEMTASPLSLKSTELSKVDEAYHNREEDEDDSTPTRTLPARDQHVQDSHQIKGHTGPSDPTLKRMDSKMNGYESEDHTSKDKQPSKDEPTSSEEPKEQSALGETKLADEQPKGVHADPGSLVTSDAEDRAIRSQGNEPVNPDTPPERSDTIISKRPSRDRASSVIQNVCVDEYGNQIMGDESRREKLMRQGSSMVKAMTIPAWQFFRLVPWHNVEGQPSSDFEVAAEFKKRPVVGVCLKRYALNQATGRIERLAADVDIPEEMRLPYTLISEEDAGSAEETPVLPKEYKFVLQSVVCHRGIHLNAGHYISFARVEPKKLRENRRHDFDPPPDYEQAQWVRHDDLDEEGRVRYVSDFQEAIKNEFPYLLFYQVMPLQDDEPSESELSDEPPSYDDEFRLSVDEPSTPVPAGRANGTAHIEQTTPDARHLQSPDRPTSRPSSIRSRPSSEVAHSRNGSNDSRRGSRNPFSSRPTSMNLESAMHSPVRSPVRTPDARDSPTMSPIDESTSSRLSRAAAAFRSKQQSRNPSQTPETRSAGAEMITRMTGILRAASREPLGEPTSLSLSNANSRANTNARPSIDSAYRPSLENHREEFMKSEKVEKGGGFLSRSGSLKKRDRHHIKKEKAEKGKSKENKGDKTPKGGLDQPDRECEVM